MPSSDSPNSAEKLLCNTLNSCTPSVDTPLFHRALGETREIETPSTSTSVPPCWPPFTLKSPLELLPGSLATPPTNPGVSAMTCTGLRMDPYTSSAIFATEPDGPDDP